MSQQPPSGDQHAQSPSDAQFYLLDRMADPMERVRLIAREDGDPALFEGVGRTRFLVESQRGVRFLVEPWQLSRVPPDEAYRALRDQRPVTRVPVMNVRLAG